jgi:hypothetical protein
MFADGREYSPATFCIPGTVSQLSGSDGTNLSGLISNHNLRVWLRRNRTKGFEVTCGSCFDFTDGSPPDSDGSKPPFLPDFDGSVLRRQILMRQILTCQNLTVEKMRQPEVSPHSAVHVRSITVTITALCTREPAIFFKLCDCRSDSARPCAKLASNSFNGRPAHPSSLLKSARRAMIATLDNFMPDAAQPSHT